jgi:hypothetical protein
MTLNNALVIDTWLNGAPNSQIFIAEESAQLPNFVTSTFCNVALAVSSIPTAFPRL